MKDTRYVSEMPSSRQEAEEHAAGATEIQAGSPNVVTGFSNSLVAYAPSQPETYVGVYTAVASTELVACHTISLNVVTAFGNSFAASAPSEAEGHAGAFTIEPSTGVLGFQTTSPNVVTGFGNSVAVSVSSAADSVELVYDPFLSERDRETSSLNKTVKLGYVPPVSSTR